MGMDADETSYDDFRRDYGQRMAEIFRIYGLPEMPGQVLGVLIASAEPVPLGELCAVLRVAKSTLSVAARRLEAFGLVHRTRRVGDRRDHYQAQDDMTQLGAHLIRRFLLPEAQATTALVQQMQQALAQGEGPDWPAEEGRARLMARTALLHELAGGVGVLLNSLLLPDGSLDHDQIGRLIALLTQLQGEHS